MLPLLRTCKLNLKSLLAYQATDMLRKPGTSFRVLRRAAPSVLRRN